MASVRWSLALVVLTSSLAVGQEVVEVFRNGQCGVIEIKATGEEPGAAATVSREVLKILTQAGLSGFVESVVPSAIGTIGGAVLSIAWSLPPISPRTRLSPILLTSSGVSRSVDQGADLLPTVVVWGGSEVITEMSLVVERRLTSGRWNEVSTRRLVTSDDRGTSAYPLRFRDHGHLVFPLRPMTLSQPGRHRILVRFQGKSTSVPEIRFTVTDRRVAPGWAEILDRDPDPAVVTDPATRRAITESGHPWRVRHKSSGIEMLLVPGGTYLRGSPASDGEAFSDERPQHQVTISKPFYLGRYEVTQAQWNKVMGSNPSRLKGDTRPVEQVSWNDIQPYLEQTGLRLPTEAEWEYACRAGTTGPRYGELDAIAWHDGNSGGRTHDLGGKAPNPWGFHDMIGNVFEWCGDGWDEDAYSKCKDGVTDPVVSVGSSRVVRGGSWSYEARHCRSANRDWVGPTFRYGSFGFRVARAP